MYFVVMRTMMGDGLVLGWNLSGRCVRVESGLCEEAEPDRPGGARKEVVRLNGWSMNRSCSTT